MILAEALPDSTVNALVQSLMKSKDPSLFELLRVVGSFAGGMLAALITLVVLPWLRGIYISSRMILEVAPYANERNHLRLINRTSFGVSNVTVYLSVEHALGEVASPPSEVVSKAGEKATVTIPAFIQPGSNAVQVREDRLAYALEIDKKHPYVLNLNSFESQSVLFCRRHPSGLISFASEQGHGSANRETPARVFLSAGSYCVLIKVVGEGMRAAFWMIRVSDIGITEPRRIRVWQAMNVQKQFALQTHNRAECKCDNYL